MNDNKGLRTDRNYLTVKEIAKELGYHQCTIYRAIQSGKLKSTSLTPKGKIFIDRKDLDALFAQNKSK